LSLGAARAGFEVRLAVDNDSHAYAGHRKNFPKTRHSNSDIRDLTGVELLHLAEISAGSVAGIIGGPPCQGFSRIGRRNVDDPRNSLFTKFFELVRDVRPSFYLAENVPGILDRAYSNVVDQALQQVKDYTHVEPFEVCASDYGAPTDRKRVLFIGYLPSAVDHLTQEDFCPPIDRPEVCVRDALLGLPTKIRDGWLSDADGWRLVKQRPTGDFWDRVFGSIPEGVGDPATLQKLRKQKRVSGCVATDHTKDTRIRFAELQIGNVDPVSRARRLDPFGFCPTIRAGTARDKGSYQAVRPIHPSEPRVITPREAARLQGFPDWFRFAPTKWHSFRQIGNSVSPIVAEQVLKVIRQRLTASDAQITQRAA
jgi:DNA (cytosine-5)-methyltransferase 1